MVVSMEVRKEGYSKYIEYIKNRLSIEEVSYTFEDFNKLNEKYMDAICLHFVYGITFREIGELLGISKSHAHAIPYYAHRKLAKL